MYTINIKKEKANRYGLSFENKGNGMRTQKCFRAIDLIGKFIGIVAAVAFFMGIVYGLNYIYVTESDWGRILWHDYYEDRGKIDNLYLGSSHVFCDINPQILDELNGEYNFNLASGSQRMNSTFYLLREADRDNELSHVYVEMFYMCSIYDDTYDADPVDNAHLAWCNIDYMKPSVNKWEYMLSVAKWGNCVELWLPFARYRSKLGDWDYVKDTIDHKVTEDYHSYQFHDENVTYMKQGRSASANELSDERRHYGPNRIMKKNPLSDKSKQYLQMTIQYCQEREIPITLYVAPMDNLRLISTLNYDNYVDEVREIADKYGIPFYDFNLVKEEYLPIHYNKYFRDLHHLNDAGAEIFTRFFYQVVSREESENAKYFYGSYAEKLRESAPAIYGIYFRNSEGGAEPSEAYKTVWVASNREEGMEYRIILTPLEGEQYMIQDFEQNKEFTVPEGETGICTIVARMTDAPNDVVQTMEIDY